MTGTALITNRARPLAASCASPALPAAVRLSIARAAAAGRILREG